MTKHTHILGAPGSKFADQWAFVFDDPANADDLLAAVRTPREGGALSTVVLNANVTAAAGRASAWALRTSDIARISAAAFARSPEVIDCDVWRDSCSFGTHDALGRPMLNAGKASPERGGLKVWISRGLILQNDVWVGHQ